MLRQTLLRYSYQTYKLTHLEQIWQGIGQYTGSACLIYGTKHRKDNHYQSRKHIADYPTVKPVCYDQLYNKLYYLWFIQQCI